MVFYMVKVVRDIKGPARPPSPSHKHTPLRHTHTGISFSSFFLSWALIIALPVVTCLDTVLVDIFHNHFWNESTRVVNTRFE